MVISWVLPPSCWFNLATWPQLQPLLSLATLIGWSWLDPSDNVKPTPPACHPWETEGSSCSLFQALSCFQPTWKTLFKRKIMAPDIITKSGGSESRGCIHLLTEGWQEWGVCMWNHSTQGEILVENPATRCDSEIYLNIVSTKPMPREFKTGFPLGLQSKSQQSHILKFLLWTDTRGGGERREKGAK